VTSANPAKIFGVANKGSIDVGKDADITLLDPNEEHMLGAKTHHHNVDSSIFEGLEVRGKIKTVIADGRIAIRNGKAEDVKKGAGKFIQRRLA
jgi:dihydropyrimidinase